VVYLVLRNYNDVACSSLFCELIDEQIYHTLETDYRALRCMASSLRTVVVVMVAAEVVQDALEV
jgi:hypothetical protein